MPNHRRMLLFGGAGSLIALLLLIRTRVSAFSPPLFKTSQQQSSEQKTFGEDIDPDLSNPSLFKSQKNDHRNHKPKMLDQPGEQLTLTGTIEAGVECSVIRSDEGLSYALSSLPSHIQPGDRITVTGTLAGSATCQQLVLVVRDWSQE